MHPPDRPSGPAEQNPHPPASPYHGGKLRAAYRPVGSHPAPFFSAAMARLTSQPPPSPDVPPGARGTVRVRVTSRRQGKPPKPGQQRQSMGRRVLAMLVTALGLWGAGSALVISARWGTALMLDPTAAPWLDALDWLAGPERPQRLSLDQLRHSLAQQGLTLGDPQTIPLNADPPLLVVPVHSGDSSHLQELRLYQSATPGQPTEQLMLRDRLTVVALAAQPVLAPLTRLGQQPQAAPTQFTFTQLTPLPASDPWFTLEGTWDNQSLTLRYGQFVYVDPVRAALVPLAPWSSPADQRPVAADLDGQNPSDWVVDQTLALEPTWAGWVVQHSPPQTQPVNFATVPLTTAEDQAPYNQALRLGRLRLWQAAHDQLALLKAHHANPWPPLAEAQLRLMAHHARHTRHQAEAVWSNPLQQVLALLADGRWEDALAQVEASPDLLPPLLQRFAGDDARFWNRVLGAKSLSEPAEAVYVWGALMVQAQDGPAAVGPWLARQTVSDVAGQRYQALIQGPAIATASAAPPDTAPLPTAVLGLALPLPAPDVARWYLPRPAAPPPARPPAQWYRIPVQAAHLDHQWHPAYTPATTDPATLWHSLSEAVQPRLQLWQGPGNEALQPLTVRGLQVDGNRVILLATGPRAAVGTVAPLAFSANALVWLDPARGTSPPQPTLAAAVEAHLFRSSAPEPDARTALGQTITVHPLDLTADGQSEQVITLADTALAHLTDLEAEPTPPAHKTLIFDAQGTLLYSDLRQPQTLVAFTNPAQGGPVGLVVYDGETYHLHQWSVQAGEFRP